VVELKVNHSKYVGILIMIGNINGKEFQLKCLDMFKDKEYLSHLNMTYYN
jgi:hypothetical protein